MLQVFGSCQTRIPEWWNPGVYRTDAVTSRCAWEHLGAPGITDYKPVSTLNCSRAVCKRSYFLWECCRCAWISLLLLIVQWFLILMYSVCTHSGRNHVNLEMPLGWFNHANFEATIERVWRWTWRPLLCEHAGGDQAQLVIQLEAMVVQCWRPW